MDKDRLPSSLLVADEVLRDLRLDYGEFPSDKARRATALRHNTSSRSLGGSTAGLKDERKDSV